MGAYFPSNSLHSNDKKVYVFIQFKTLLHLLYSHFSKDTEKIYNLWLDYNYVGLVFLGRAWVTFWWTDSIWYWLRMRAWVTWDSEIIVCLTTIVYSESRNSKQLGEIQKDVTNTI